MVTLGHTPHKGPQFLIGSRSVQMDMGKRELCKPKIASATYARAKLGACNKLSHLCERQGARGKYGRAKIGKRKGASANGQAQNYQREMCKLK